MLSWNGESRYAWMHPSWRDVVIEHLMSHPADRQRFLASCSMVGVELALSSSGGRRGERERPLLRTPKDWQTLRTRVLQLVPVVSTDEHRRLLTTLREVLTSAHAAENAAETETFVEGLLPVVVTPWGPGEVAEVETLARDLLAAIVAAWDEAATPIPDRALRAFYDASTMVAPLAPGPVLDASWDDGVAALDEALVDLDDYADLAEVLAFFVLVQENEPRYMRMRPWRVGRGERLTEVAAEIERLAADAWRVARELADPDTDAELEEVAALSWEAAHASEVIAHLHALDADWDPDGEVEEKLDQCVSELDSWVDERVQADEEAMVALAEEEDDEEDDDEDPSEPPASQGPPPFDLDAVFADL